MNKPKQVDVIIVGAGMVGLATAAALVKANFSVAIIEAHEPTLTWQEKDYDARVSAINPHSKLFLDDLNIWNQLDPKGIASVEKMQVWDAIGGGEIEFSESDVAQDNLAWIVENREIVRGLWDFLQRQKQAQFFCPEHGEAIDVDSDNIVLQLKSGQSVSGQLLIGADGGRSWVRKKINMSILARTYHQSAIVAVIESEKPHWHTAYQAFLSTGPLGVLPLAKANHSAIVWSADTHESDRLMQLDDDAFNLALTNAMQLRLGSLAILNQRVQIPLTARHAQSYISDRVALVGDAAHTIHPLAGQGVNLGFKDVESLCNQLIHARECERDIGSRRVLRAYERERKGDNAKMLTAMRGFKELFASQNPLVSQLRSTGLNAVNKSAWLKKYFLTEAGN